MSCISADLETGIDILFDIIIFFFCKVLPKEVFEPNSERMLFEPVHPELVLLPRLWRVFPTDRPGGETKGTTHRSLSS